MDDKVLVFGDDTRSFLAIARSLGRQGIGVHAAPMNFRSPALRSRYVTAVHEIPPWLGNENEWLDAVARLLSAERYKLVISCNATNFLPPARRRTVISQL